MPSLALSALAVAAVVAPSISACDRRCDGVQASLRARCARAILYGYAFSVRVRRRGGGGGCTVSHILQSPFVAAAATAAAATATPLPFREQSPLSERR